MPREFYSRTTTLATASLNYYPTSFESHLPQQDITERVSQHCFPFSSSWVTLKVYNLLVHCKVFGLTRQLTKPIWRIAKNNRPHFSNDIPEKKIVKTIQLFNEQNTILPDSSFFFFFVSSKVTIEDRRKTEHQGFLFNLLQSIKEGWLLDKKMLT